MGKFFERLKVPRSARTVEIVVNIPESVIQTPPIPNPTVPKSTQRGRIWAFLQTAGPAIASIVAIVISILALIEQRSADVSQTAASQRQQAQQVSFLQENELTGFNDLTIVVQNLSANTVHFVSLYIEVGTYSPHSNPGTHGLGTVIVDFELNDIPACVSTIINIGQEIKQFLGTYKNPPFTEVSPPEVYVQSMTFTDSNGIIWRDFSGGGLQQLTSQPNLSDLNYVISTTYKAASGCA